MNQENVNMDPLSSYEYPAYDSYPLNTPQMYPYNVKLEDTLYYKHNNTNHSTYNNTCSQPPINQQELTKEDNIEEKKPVVSNTKKEKKSFCSEKINDTSFPFYGCSVCNISYMSLYELDQHVTIHKNRMTSYRLRLRNQYRKKQIKKEKKKLKKKKKIKEETDVEIEIKPEDGYIGNEKAVDYNNTVGNGSVENCENKNNDQNKNQEDVKNFENLNSNDENQKNNGESCSNNGENLNNNGEGCINNDESQKDNSENHNSNDESHKSCENEEELNNMEKIYKCFACQKQFTLSYYLKLHVRSHTDEKPYTCSVCGQSFITASKLGRHNKRIHLAARFQCRICFKIFSRFELLTNHFDKNHPEDKLEGEPYDYNAILPYLKELEEQLKEQSETKEQKTEDTWFDCDFAVQDSLKEETQDDSKEFAKIDVVLEDRINCEMDVEVKMEEEHYPGDDNIHGGDDEPVDDKHDDKAAIKEVVNKDDSFSDEDYFPANTWAATPKCDPSPPPSPKPKKKFKMSKCEICQKEISSASYMRVHMRTHTGEKPFKCYKCGRGFITSSKLNRHTLTHDVDVKTEGIKLEKDDIKSEGEEINDDDKPASSKITKKKNKLKKKLSKDLKGDDKVRRKRQKRPHACEYCNQRFLHLHMLEVHKKCHEGEELVLKCHYCLEEAIDADALKEHESTHSGPKPYLCTICGRNYKKRETMVYHRKHHQPEREYICDVCSKRFSAAGKLAKHLRTHSEDKFVLRYECPVCAHMFHTKYHVQMHLSTHQREGLIMESNRNEVLAMVLQNALKIPKQPDAAATLTEITPSDERYRICKICGETFHHFYYLEEHLKSHGSKIAIDNTNKTEEKKYICEVCNKAFKLHYYLKLHSFTHSKEKPFMCQQCGKGFITKGKLKRHLETHTGLKKYQCHICYKFFTRPSYLRIHIRTIHGTQDFNFRFDKSNLKFNGISALNQISNGQSSV